MERKGQRIFYDENGRAIYSYGQQESGITTYKKNNKYNLPEKVEDYLGNIQENEYIKNRNNF